MTVFIHIDGDNIGNNIELLLMDGRLNDAEILSNKIRNSFESITKKLKSELNAKVHIYAGDDVIVSTENISKLEILKKIRKEFNIQTNLTLSIGIGNSIESSLLNLRRAKISGRNKIIGLNNE